MQNARFAMDMGKSPVRIPRVVHHAMGKVKERAIIAMAAVSAIIVTGTDGLVAVIVMAKEWLHLNVRHVKVAGKMFAKRAAGLKYALYVVEPSYVANVRAVLYLTRVVIW
jgi:hypothetical protein